MAKEVKTKEVTDESWGGYKRRSPHLGHTEPYGEKILTLKVKGQESKQVRGK